MNKKQKTIIIMLALVLIMVLLYVLITKKDSKTVEVVSADTFYKADAQISSIDLAIEGGKASIKLSNSANKWHLSSDSIKSFPLDQSKITTLADELRNLSYTREIKDYGSLSDFGLGNEARSVNVHTSDGQDIVFLFSPIVGVDNKYYFTLKGRDVVYMTDSKFCTYCEKDLLYYALIPEVPDFSTLDISSVSFDMKNGEKLRLTPEEQSDSKTKKSFSEKSWKYYVKNMGEGVSDAKSCDASDMSVLNNYLCEFMYNKAVAIDDGQTDLSLYGLDDPLAVITIEFSGITNRVDINSQGGEVTQLVSADFVMKLSIGNKVSETDGEYYVKAECTDSVNAESEYGSSCILTMNSVYGKYFSGMTESRLNGAASSEIVLLENEKLPALTDDNLVKLSFNYGGVQGKDLGYNESFSLDNNEDQWMIELSDGNRKAADESKVSQLIKFFTESGYFKYLKREGLAEEITDIDLPNEAARKEDDFSPKLSISITYMADSDHNDSLDTPVHWTLYILEAKDDTAYYVSADNAVYIYSMDSVFIDYLLELKAEDF